MERGHECVFVEYTKPSTRGFAISGTSSFNGIPVDLTLPSVAIAALPDDDVYIMDTNEINYVTDLGRILKMSTL